MSDFFKMLVSIPIVINYTLVVLRTVGRLVAAPDLGDWSKIAIIIVHIAMKSFWGSLGLD